MTERNIWAFGTGNGALMSMPYSEEDVREWAEKVPHVVYFVAELVNVED